VQTQAERAFSAPDLGADSRRVARLRADGSAVRAHKPYRGVVHHMEPVRTGLIPLKALAIVYGDPIGRKSAIPHVSGSARLECVPKASVLANRFCVGKTGDSHGSDVLQNRMLTGQSLPTPMGD